MNVLRDFIVANKDLIVLVAVVFSGLIVLISVLIKRRRQEEQYDEDMATRNEMTVQPIESIHDQDEDNDEGDEEDDNDDEQEDYTSVLAECRERVSNFLKKLDFLQNIYVDCFDEDQELSGKGYMYALIKFFLNGYESWIIFYPNFDYNLIMMIYNKRIPDDKITEITDIIDDFYDDEGDFFIDEDDYPFCLWDDEGEYYFLSLVQNLTRAAQKKSVWYGLLKQFQNN